MEKPFVIYLDIDGVLVSYLNFKDRHPVDGRHAFLDGAVKALNSIISLVGPDVELCVVSTWARGRTPNELREIFLLRGIADVPITVGDIDYRARYVIQRKSEGYDRYLVIDDEAYEYIRRIDEIGYNRLIYTNSFRGLDEFDVVTVSRNLSRIVI